MPLTENKVDYMPINVKIKGHIYAINRNKTLTPHLLSITEYPYFSSLWVKIDQLKTIKRIHYDISVYFM